MTVVTATGLTASTTYTIRLLQPSAVDSNDADRVISTTSCASDGSGDLSVNLPANTGNTYYFAALDTNLYAFVVPESGGPYAITSILSTPAKSIIQFPITEINGKFGPVVDLTFDDIAGTYTVSVNGESGVVTFSFVPPTRTVNDYPLSSDVEIRIQDLGYVDITSPADGDTLSYDHDAGEWKNKPPASGGLLDFFSLQCPWSAPGAYKWITSTFPDGGSGRWGGYSFLEKTSDSSKISLSFTAPQSGKVKLTLEGHALANIDGIDQGFAGFYIADSTGFMWGASTGSGPPDANAKPTVMPMATFLTANSGGSITSYWQYPETWVHMEWVIDGLTPGDDYTMYLGGFIGYTQGAGSTAGTSVFLISQPNDPDEPSGAGSIWYYNGPQGYFMAEAL